MTDPPAHYFIVQCIRDGIPLGASVDVQTLSGMSDSETIALCAEENERENELPAGIL